MAELRTENERPFRGHGGEASGACRWQWCHGAERARGWGTSRDWEGAACDPRRDRAGCIPLLERALRNGAERETLAGLS